MILASSGARARAPFLGLAALAVATSTLLAACGGGGGSSNRAESPVASAESPPARTLAPGAEPAPTLDAPQPGSTATTGDGRQGIYQDFVGYTFISPKGRLNRKGQQDWFFGSIEGNGAAWSFRRPTLSRSTSSGFSFITGSGTFEPRKSMSGTFSKDGQNLSSPWGPLDYSPANALAVTQEALAGKWRTTANDGLEMSIEIDATGAVTGRTTGSQLGTCTVTGSIRQTEPATSRNLFDVAFTLANAATGTEVACAFAKDGEFIGLGGVVMLAASIFPEEGAYRTFYFNTAAPTFAVMTNVLRKEQ